MEPKAKTASSTVYVPENIIFTILSLLPVPSLVRFISVCKLWLSIISNNLFIQTHLVNSHNKQAFLLKGRAFTAAPPSEWMLCYVNPTCEEFISLNLPPQCNAAKVRYIRSCNGLVCLAFDKACQDLYIVNPSTKRFKRIPTPTPTIRGQFGVRLNFGFDCITNDYKLLRSVCDVSINYFEAEVYSANADSWTEIQPSEILQYSRIFPTSVMHTERYRKLIPFDALLDLYPLPSYRYQDLSTRSRLLDFEGSFAVIGSNINEVFSLLMLENVCGRFSWNKKFDLESDSKIFWVVTYLGDGQFVAVLDSDLNQYVLYDYKKKETKKFLQSASFEQISVVTKYTESLVSLDGFEPWE